jgi:threonine dehydratase
VHSANEPLLIAGVATYALEIFEEIDPPDVVFAPIGGGSGAAGLTIVRTAIGAHTKVIGVQAEAADAFARSWRGPERVVGTVAATFAEGMASRVTFDLTFGILKKQLDEVITLSEEELAEGVRLALRATHNLTEGAGSASLMAAVKVREQLQGKRVVCVMSGGNGSDQRVSH